MLKDKKTPEIRFKGFTEDWEQRKLEEICNRFDNLRVPVAANQREKGNIPYYGANGIQDYVKGFTHKGEFILIAEDGANDLKNYPVNYVNGLFWANNHVHVLQSKEKIGNNKFLKFCISRTNIEHLLVGGGRAKLNSNIMMNMDLKIPAIVEQEKIGNILFEIDNLITLHQRKCDKLLNFKKSMLEKMFPKNSSNFPEIRFKGFTDAWEQRKWIDMVNISTEMVDPKSGKYDNLPHIGPGNIESFTGQFYDNIKKVGEENLISGKFHFYPEDIIYGKINPQLGKYVFPLFEGLSSADSYVLNAKNGLNQKYLYTLLQTTDFYKYSVSVSMRSGMPKINRDELNAYEFSMPKGNEQQQIGALFLEIDNLITLHQRKLEKLKNIKTSMLNKMFI